MALRRAKGLSLTITQQTYTTGVSIATEREQHEAFLTPARTVGIILLILVTLGCLIYLWQSWEHRQLVQRVRIGQESLTRLQAEHQQLEFELAQYHSLDRIERIARERLGMAEPETVVYVPRPLFPLLASKGTQAEPARSSEVEAEAEVAIQPGSER
ncbi:MAG: septum formation initiator family protein [Candidatus Bipolaricaulia bacterium]